LLIGVAVRYWGTAKPPRQRTFVSGNQAFHQAIHSVDNLGVNFSRLVSIVAEEGSAPFARELVGIFIAASWTPEDHGGNGEYVGTPKRHRLLPGITISAPVPSGGAEAVRVAFERIGIPTRRKTDQSRADEYLIIEIGSMHAYPVS
jgi:hypothetical protein